MAPGPSARGFRRNQRSLVRVVAAAGSESFRNRVATIWRSQAEHRCERSLGWDRRRELDLGPAREPAPDRILSKPAVVLPVRVQAGPGNHIPVVDGICLTKDQMRALKSRDPDE